jgi:hypothetical protein
VLTKTTAISQTVATSCAGFTAIGMGYKEAADEIKRLRPGAEPGFNNFDEAGGNKPDRSIGNIPAPIFWSLAIGQVVFLGWLIFQTLGWL